MYVLVRAGPYPGLSVYCLLLTTSPVFQNICSGVREILFCTSVLVEQSVCVHPLFVLYCIVYYKRERVCVCVRACVRACVAGGGRAGGGRCSHVPLMPAPWLWGGLGRVTCNANTGSAGDSWLIVVRALMSRGSGTVVMLCWTECVAMSDCEGKGYGVFLFEPLGMGGRGCSQRKGVSRGLCGATNPWFWVSFVWVIAPGLPLPQHRIPTDGAVRGPATVF